MVCGRCEYFYIYIYHLANTEQKDDIGLSNAFLGVDIYHWQKKRNKRTMFI